MKCFKFFCIALYLIFIVPTSFGSVKAESQNNSIPFIVGYNVTTVDSNGSNIVKFYDAEAMRTLKNYDSYSGYAMGGVNNGTGGFEKIKRIITPVIKWVSKVSLTKFMQNIRATICEGIKPGSIKLSVALDEKGEPVGVGAGATESIEVTFECPNK